NMHAFMRAAGAHQQRTFADYDALYQWSIAAPEAFWREVWSFCGVIGDGPGAITVEHRGRMPGARWFPQARLNYAENLLRRNEKLVGAHFSIGVEDAVFLRGELPFSSVNEKEVDRVIGTLFATVEAVFPSIIRIGFASRFAQ
ncbi:MAG: hypothetical protein RL430_1472, partial [Actinomycetota bacterium]